MPTLALMPGRRARGAPAGADGAVPCRARSAARSRGPASERERDGDVGHARGLGQHVEVTDDHGSTGDDPERSANSPNAWIAPRVRRQRPSAGWYGSVAVPTATCSRRRTAAQLATEDLDEVVLTRIRRRSGRPTGDRPLARRRARSRTCIGARSPCTGSATTGRTCRDAIERRPAGLVAISGRHEAKSRTGVLVPPPRRSRPDGSRWRCPRPPAKDPMTDTNADRLRRQLIAFLDGDGARMPFDEAVPDFPDKAIDASRRMSSTRLAPARAHPADPGRHPRLHRQSGLRREGVADGVLAGSRRDRYGGPVRRHARGFRADVAACGDRRRSHDGPVRDDPEHARHTILREVRIVGEHNA